MKNNGTKSEDIFEKKFKDLGKSAWVYRITDTKEATRGKAQLVIKKQPADYIVCCNGKMFFAEVKSCSHLTSFPFSAIRQGQMNAMAKTIAAGTDYFIYIHNLNTNTWYKVNAHVIEAVKEEKQSMKWSELEHYKLTEKTFTQ